MSNRNRKFLDILKIELQDLRADFEELKGQIVQKRERGDLTNYVCMENLALLENELLGLQTCSRMIDETDETQFETLDALAEHVKTTLRERVRAAGLAEAICEFLDRKVEKVRGYTARL